MKIRMDLIKSLLITCLLSVTGSAQAVSIDVTQIIGAWTNVIIGSPNSLSGLGTHEIHWGLPIDGNDESAFSFAGVTSSGGQVESAFSLGQFTYLNNLVTGEAPESANLHFAAEFDVDGTTVASNSLAVQFDLHQIPGNCGRPNCSRDLVKLKNTDHIATFVVGDMTYSLSILGFGTSNGLKTVLQTFDGSSSSAELVGVITATEVAEPGTLVLVLMGLMMLTINGRRAARARQQNRS